MTMLNHPMSEGQEVKTWLIEYDNEEEWRIPIRVEDLKPWDHFIRDDDETILVCVTQAVRAADGVWENYYFTKEEWQECKDNKEQAQLNGVNFEVQ